jgi:cytochrome c-type biogenesis protein CcmH
MTLFWVIAALLVAVALLFLLPPLLRRGAIAQEADKKGTAASERSAHHELNIAVYRDQQNELDADRRAGTLTDEQYERARLELERRLLEDVAADQATPPPAQPPRRAPAIMVGLAVPLLAIPLYFTVGNPRALAPVALPKDASQGVTAEQVEAMVAKLAERMKQNPDDPQGWAMLGKSYAVMGRFEDAAAAYGKAVARVGDNPNLLADYADALAMANGQNLQGEPEALILRALKIDPDHAKSLALAGTVAFEKKDFTTAIAYWEKLVKQVPPDTEMARNVQSSIAEARALAGESKGGGASAAAKPGGVSGTVTLAPALKAKAAPDDTVFIFARAASKDGPRMPLAILRKKVSELPVTFTLDDSSAMSPATRLSGTPQVIIGARISKSGNAMPQPGDLQGLSKPIENTGKGIGIVIDTEVK